MKNEQVIPNYKLMFESSITLLALVASGWLLIKLVSACFWLPSALRKFEMEQRDAEKKYIEEEEEKRKKALAAEAIENDDVAEKAAFIDNEDTGNDDVTKKDK